MFHVAALYALFLAVLAIVTRTITGTISKIDSGAAVLNLLVLSDPVSHAGHATAMAARITFVV